MLEIETEGQIDKHTGKGAGTPPESSSTTGQEGRLENAGDPRQGRRTHRQLERSQVRQRSMAGEEKLWAVRWVKFGRIILLRWWCEAGDGQ